ncbi:MAG: hypothetical protein LBO72_10370 [Helicobacteraceae bacterium]|jgi:hypothetical protein|nr:hypothetical protein [Helicobacteraceae bacterium]
MAYVNEEISDKDWEEYERIVAAKRFRGGGGNRDWTIDREREIWFKVYERWTDIEDDGKETRTLWDFYWKGVYVPAETKRLKMIPYNTNNGVYYAYIKILEIEIPKNAQQHKSEILKELKAALEASFVGLGIYAYGGDLKSCKVDLEYEGALVF